MREVVTKRGWSDQIIMLSLGGDVRPSPKTGELLREWVPYARWHLVSHFSGDPSPKDGKLIATGGLEVGLGVKPWCPLRTTELTGDRPARFVDTGGRADKITIVGSQLDPKKARRPMRFAANSLLLILALNAPTHATAEAVGQTASASRSGTATANPRLFGGDAFRSTVLPFLTTHCIACHGADGQNAGIRFDRLPAGFAVDDAALWTRTYRVIESGRMPPESEKRPESGHAQAVKAWIIDQSHAARSALGSGSQRRLNRREYAALFTNVLKLNLPQFEKYLPGDRLVEGFDTVASGLQDATAAVNVAQEVVSVVLQRIDFLETKTSPPEGLFGDFVSGKHEAVGRLAKREFIRPRGGGLVEPHFVNDALRQGNRGKGLEVRVTYDRTDFDGGFMRIRLDVASLAPPGVAAPTLRFNADQRFEITGDPDHPQTVEFLLLPRDCGPPTVHNWKGHPPYYEYAAGFFANQRTLPLDPSDILDAKGHLAESPEFTAAVKAKDTSYPASWLQFQKYEIEPSYRHQWLTPEERATLSADDSDAMVVVRKLAASAFRRPVSSAEDRWLESFFKRCRGEGLGLDDSIRLTAEMIFASAAARTLLPTDVGDPALRNYAIASRLSFGLIGQPPDSRLMELAAAGKLGEPSVLREEIDRLLDHPNCMAGFLMPFTTMWLALGQPKAVVVEEKNPGVKKFNTIQTPNLGLFREHIAAGMNQESPAYFGIMLRENLPARELLDSDWLPMNDAMAYHYGYPRIFGHRFQKVKLRPDDPRGGGILGQAGVMSMTTWMGPNWPTYRGVWALRHVLNNPPPPAPLDVPELDHKEHKGEPLRAKLAAHTTVASCAVCHKLIDPVGFAFQHFDVSGRWQENEAESNTIETNEDGQARYLRTGKTWPVDPNGALPRGEKFTTWQEFKRLAAVHYAEDLARGQLQRYVRFFASREPTVVDEVALEKLLDRGRDRNFPMRDMLKDFLTSEIFLSSVKP